MATAAIEGENRSLSIGRVFNRAFSVIGSNPLLIFGVALLIGAVPRFGAGYAIRGIGLDMLKTGSTAGLIVVGTLTYLLAIVCQALVQAVVVDVTLVDREGRRAAFAESVGRALTRSIPLLAVSLLFTIGLLIGFALLIVPFFFLATRWAVVPAVVIAERPGVIGAFRRSAELTAGARPKVLGLGILTVIVAWLFAAVGGTIGVATVGFQGVAAGQLSTNPIALFVNVIAATVSGAFWASMQGSLYVELSDWKDGPTTNRLAEIFR